MGNTKKRQLLGRYIIADPEICHGEPTFRGTRIFVADVLEMVAEGMAWESIVEEWGGSITKEAIAEAVQFYLLYYDVEEDPEPEVYIRAVGVKERNRVRIGKEVIEL